MQWDVAVEFGVSESLCAWRRAGVRRDQSSRAGARARTTPSPAGNPSARTRATDYRPPSTSIQPASLALQVRVVNAVAAAATARPMSFDHRFTVPQDQREEGYFAAPLARRLDRGSGHRAELRPGAARTRPDEAAGTSQWSRLRRAIASPGRQPRRAARPTGASPRERGDGPPEPGRSIPRCWPAPGDPRGPMTFPSQVPGARRTALRRGRAWSHLSTCPSDLAERGSGGGITMQRARWVSGDISAP